MSDSSFHGFWHIEPANDPRLKNLLFEWHLETPIDGDAYDSSKPLQVSGWALAEESQHAHLHLVLRLPGLTPVTSGESRSRRCDPGYSS